MRTKRLYFILVGLLLAGGLFALFNREREPVYGGKKLSEWVLRSSDEGYPVNASNVVQITEREASKEEAQDAIRHIGTNAVPFLLKWGLYRVPAWKTSLYRAAEPLPEGLRRLVHNVVATRRVRLVSCLPDAFGALGSQGQAAIPELTRRINNPNADEWTQSDLQALAELGPEALPPLMEMAVNPQHEMRVDALLLMTNLGTNARPALPALIGLLHDPATNISTMAARTLGELQLEAALVVPALVQALSDRRGSMAYGAALALKAFGSEARAAVPELRLMLESTNSRLREVATKALQTIAPEVLQIPKDATK